MTVMINIEFGGDGNLRKVREVMESGGVCRGFCTCNTLFFQLGWEVNV